MLKDSEIGKNPPNWNVVSLKETAQDGTSTFVHGPFGSDLKVTDHTNEGIMLIQLPPFLDFDRYHTDIDQFLSIIYKCKTR